jgi:long-chain acyl-CoA synthetase
MNLYQVFHATALRQPDRPAIIKMAVGNQMSYHELDEAIANTSQRLQAAGVLPGDCIGLHFASSAEYIVFTYAVWRCGACVIPLPLELAVTEKQEILRCLAIDKIISARRGSAMFSTFRRGELFELAVEAEVFAVEARLSRPAELANLNPAFIRFTSGTTGAAKGVVLSHETVLERIAAANEVLNLRPSDRVLWVLSMAYHFTVSIVAYLTYGAAIVLPKNHFASAVVEAAQLSQATILYASPMHYALLADFPDARAVPSLRRVISTTSSLNLQAAHRFRERYGKPIDQALGIIEIGLPCINAAQEPERWNSVGRVLPAYNLRLNDVGLGEDAKEIVLRGPGMLDAYYHPWQTRQEILRDGWFHTGDVGRVDRDGYLYLTGRTKDVINIMGMKFFPQEVERVLASHPNVSAVSVFAARDERWGEAVGARVVACGPDDDQLASRLQAYCRQHVAEYKVPRHIEFVSVLPRTASGKVLHRAL